MHFDILFEMEIGLYRFSTIENITMKSPYKPPILTLNAILVTY